MSDTQGGGTAGSGADRMREGMEKARDAFNERVVEPARRVGEAARASGQKLAEGNSSVGLKMIDQAERNMHEAFAAMRNAARAKDISEVMKIQADFLREQGARSMEQARELGQLIVEVGREAVTPMREAGKTGSGV